MMPRPKGSPHVWTPAIDVMSGAIERLGIGSQAVNNILLDATDANRIRMIGKIVSQSGARQEIKHIHVESARKQDLRRVPLDLFKCGFSVMPAFHREKAFDYPSLCDSESNIFLSHKDKNKFVAIIVSAHLHNKDRDRVFSQTLEWPNYGAPRGRARNDRLWGDFILEVIDLNQKGGLHKPGSRKVLMEALIRRHDEVNEKSIRNVLDYVFDRIEAGNRQ